MSTWKQAPLGELAEAQLGKMLDQKKNVGEYRPYLGNDNVQWNHFQLDEIKKMRFEDSELERFRLRRGDLLVCERGGPGRCALWESDDEVYYQKALHRVRVGKELEPRYLLYYLINIGKTKEIQSYYTGGATIKHLPAAALKRVVISYPSPSVQRRIADILSAYDRLIENNRKQIKLLEEAAQRLYKEWFVDLRFPSRETTPIIDGLPEGWKKGKLGDIVEFRRGKTITQNDTLDGNAPVVAGGLEPAYYHAHANTSSPVVTVSGSGANAGFCRLHTTKIWASDCSFADSSMTDNLLFAYASIKVLSNGFKQCQRGSAQSHVYPKHVNSLGIVIPSCTYLGEFNHTAKALYSKIGVLSRQISAAREARDRLLPKLMSGEIEVWS